MSFSAWRICLESRKQSPAARIWDIMSSICFSVLGDKAASSRNSLSLAETKMQTGEFACSSVCLASRTIIAVPTTNKVWRVLAHICLDNSDNNEAVHISSAILIAMSVFGFWSWRTITIHPWLPDWRCYIVLSCTLPVSIQGQSVWENIICIHILSLRNLTFHNKVILYVVTNQNQRPLLRKKIMLRRNSLGGWQL